MILLFDNTEAGKKQGRSREDYPIISIIQTVIFVIWINDFYPYDKAHVSGGMVRDVSRVRYVMCLGVQYVMS